MTTELIGGAKQLKVVVKEVFKQTAACNACKVRRRKCDGKAPCAYCASKNQPCQFSQQKRRGPAPKKEISAEQSHGFVAKLLSLNAASYEREILEMLEAKNFVNQYFTYISHRSTIKGLEQLLSPLTTANKIQAYATLAFASRICGDGPKAATYIAQARTLAGSIFDSPEPDSVSALLMISNYFQIILNIPLAMFYLDVTVGLSKLTKLQGKLIVFCRVGKLLRTTDTTTTHKQKSEVVKQELQKVAASYPDLAGTTPFLIVTAEILNTLKYNILFPEEDSIKKFFHVLDDIVVGEEDRARLLSAIHDMRIYASTMPHRLMFFFRLLSTLYSAILNWKSGRITDAVVCARSCIDELLEITEKNLQGIVTDFPHICMLGCLCKFLHEQGLYHELTQVVWFIRDICQIMQPEFDFVLGLLDEFSPFLSNSIPINNTLNTFNSNYDIYTSQQTNITLNNSDDNNIPNTFNDNVKIDTYSPVPVYDNNINDNILNNDIYNNITISNLNNNNINYFNENNNTLLDPPDNFHILESILNSADNALLD